MSTTRIYMSPPHMSGGEQKWIAEAFDLNWVAPAGPHLQRFEKEVARHVNVSHAAAVVSGTAALHLALRYLQLSPESEVICPTFTFCASVNPILYEHARPVFLDVDRTSWNLDPNLLEEELKAAAAAGRLPKAILVVHILGQSADMDPIEQLAAQYEIPIVEDAAEALGASYRGRPCGSLGWCSAISFNGNKIITTSGGGMLCSDDQRLIDKARHWATQAKDPGPLYFHSEVGFNYRMSNLLAAVGLGQMEVLQERIDARHAVSQYYRERLGKIDGVSFSPVAEYGQPNYWLTVIRLDPARTGTSCEELRLMLEEQNIESRRVWVPIHKQPPYQPYRYRGGDVAEGIFADSLCLPSGSSLTDDDLQRICRLIELKLMG